MAGFVIVRTYSEPVEAQLDRTRLESEGIRAIVLEPTGYNPALTAAVGGVRLEVDPQDLERAQIILRDPGPDPGDGDEEIDPDEVRCPRCELPYCAFERPKLRGLAPGGVGLLALVASGVLATGLSRWRCHRCEHVWDDPKEGPKAPTALLPGDPRPVFRLRRAHPGMGLFLGLVVGFFAVKTLGGIAAVALLLLSPIVGWVIGSSIASDVCSEPKCREVLRKGVEKCPGCRGAVAGRVTYAAEHYAAAADYRRELAEARRKDEARPKRKGKKASGA